VHARFAATLAHLEYLGTPPVREPMHALIPRCALLENFSPAEGFC